MAKKKVLFICVHNSARSQMAEAYLKQFGNELFDTESAGYEPSDINPLVVAAMREDGIDLSGKKSQSVFQLYRSNRFFGYIVTVCDRAQEADCPTFPGVKKRLHWNLENPESFTGTDDEKMEKVRVLRDKVKTLVLEFIETESE